MKQLNPHTGRRVPPEARIVGENLRSLREQAGLTQKQIARILGVTFQQIQKYERGENRLPVEKLHALKNHFGVPYHIFFRGLDAEKEGEIPWPGNVTERLARVKNFILRDKIDRVVSIMLE